MTPNPLTRLIEEKIERIVIDYANYFRASDERAFFRLALHKVSEDTLVALKVEIEKLIDDNDDGLWAGRETADKILTFINEAIKIKL